MTGEPDPEYNRIAEPFRDDLDLAFFVVNFGYTPSDYNSLTPRQKLLIMKEWETKFVRDTSYVSSAVNNAIVNAHRKKGKPALSLWKHKPKKGDKQEAQNAFETIKRMETNNGKEWVKKIYRENHLNYQKAVIENTKRKAKQK